MPRKSSLENAFDTKYVHNHYLEGKCSENRYCKMCLAQNVTLKANAKEIVT